MVVDNRTAISFFVKNVDGNLERREVGKKSMSTVVRPASNLNTSGPKLCVSQSPAFFVKTSCSLEKHEIGETKKTSTLSLPINQLDAVAAVRFFLKSGSGLLVECTTAYDLGDLFKASQRPSFGKAYRGAESANCQNEQSTSPVNTRCVM